MLNNNNNNNNNNPHNPRGRRLAVPAFLDFSLPFNPRDLYYNNNNNNNKNKIKNNNNIYSPRKYIYRG